MNASKLATFLSIGLFLGTAATFTNAAESTTQPNQQATLDKPKADQAAEGVKNLATALNLVDFARANKSVPAMLAAVEILQKTPSTQDDKHFGDKSSAASPKPADASGKPAGPKTAAAPALDPKALLAEAKTWAQGNQQLSALVDAAAGHQGAGLMGASNGPILHRDRVNEDATDSYTITFTGNEVARIAVIGDGDNDLDLYVYDSAGHLICQDDDNTDNCLVQWVPAWTGRFTVKIVNRGHWVYSNYVLMTN